MMAADITGLSPADGATGVNVGANLVLTFSDPVQPGPGTGALYIKNASDGSTIEAIDVHSDRVTFDGATMTIDPVNNLPAETKVYVVADVAAVRDMATNSANVTIFSEDFEDVPLSNTLLTQGFDDYVVIMTGVLDVKVAGEYTFGIASDDGQRLLIDLDQNGELDDAGDDLIIEDDTTHGTQDRLSSCGYDFAAASCEGAGLGSGIQLDVGEYAFEFLYFDAGGGGNGEFFYAPGYHEIFTNGEFAVVGDDSKGIGVTADGITATTYKAAAGIEVTTVLDGPDLRDGTLDVDPLFPVSALIATATVAENSGAGHFRVGENPIPGRAEWALANDPSLEDVSSVPPAGWTEDNSFLLENRPGGPAEYEGWSFWKKDQWIIEQGNQSRVMFELGQGVVALVDPDAYDDFVDIDSDSGDTVTEACVNAINAGTSTAGGDCGYFTSSMDTPAIYLDGVAENSAKLKFDNSWYDESTQSAEGSVEYFNENGESLGSSRLFRWESVPDTENFRPHDNGDGTDTRNETLEFELNNPAGAASMIITFAMPYGENDWWWAIDNLVVTADVTGAVSGAVSDPTAWSFTTGAGGGQTLPGDIDGDGTVQFPDFVILANNFGKTVPANTLGDLDGDGIVQFPDFVILANNFGKTLNAAAPINVSAATDNVFAELGAAIDANGDDDDGSSLLG